jgi:hypothetical protein
MSYAWGRTLRKCVVTGFGKVTSSWTLGETLRQDEGWLGHRWEIDVLSLTGPPLTLIESGSEVSQESAMTHR